MKTTEIKKDFSGEYNSTYGFVSANKLEKEAIELFGEEWEAEDDISQIESLIEHISGQGKFYKVYCDEHRDEDDIIVELSEDKIKIHELEKVYSTEELIDIHEKIRNILIDYGNEEYGDCIIDEICIAVGIPDTTVYYEEE